MSEAIPAIDQKAAVVESEAPFEHLHPLSIVLKSISLLGRNIILIGVLYFSLFD